MRDNDKKTTIILSVIGIIPVVWLGLKIAPYVKGGLPEIVSGLMSSFNSPFSIELVILFRSITYIEDDLIK